MNPPKNYLIDMDGVLITGGTMIPGADGFLARLKAREAKFLILTNNSRYTPGDLSHRLHGTRAGCGRGQHLHVGDGDRTLFAEPTPERHRVRHR